MSLIVDCMDAQIRSMRSSAISLSAAAICQRLTRLPIGLLKGVITSMPRMS